FLWGYFVFRCLDFARHDKPTLGMREPTLDKPTLGMREPTLDKPTLDMREPTLDKPTLDMTSVVISTKATAARRDL
ncbi:MAG: hypothetical protein ACI4TU_09770, partial [Candidatus Cryptobacteroides sp.]